MAKCVTCGGELHPERAEKYEYCTQPECQERNTRGLEMVAVGVNKAAEQYVLLDERTKREMASGRYKKQPEIQASAPPGVIRRTRRSRPVPTSAPRPPRPAWSDAQERLAVIYRDMGLKPAEIAKKLGVSSFLATQILLAATAGGRRSP